MTKRAASMKPKVVTQNQELPPIEDTFDQAKQVFTVTAETAVKVSERIENLINIRRAVYEFWGTEFDSKFLSLERLRYFKNLQKMITSVYEDIADIVKTFDLDEFLKEDMKDYFDPIMPKVEQIEDEEGLFKAWLISTTIKPWGEKMTALHHQMLDEKAAREQSEN